MVKSITCVSLLSAAVLAVAGGAFPTLAHSAEAVSTEAGEPRAQVLVQMPANALAQTLAVPGKALALRAQMVQGQRGRICGRRADIVAQLGTKYGERRRSMGVTGRTGVMEVFASDETGSWTVLMTNPQGVTCLMAAGEAFESAPAEQVGSPA